MCQEDGQILEENAAGIDVGAVEMFVAVPPDRDQHPVRVFDTYARTLTYRQGIITEDLILALV